MLLLWLFALDLLRPQWRTSLRHVRPTPAKLASKPAPTGTQRAFVGGAPSPRCFCCGCLLWTCCGLNGGQAFGISALHLQSSPASRLLREGSALL